MPIQIQIHRENVYSHTVTRTTCAAQGAIVMYTHAYAPIQSIVHFCHSNGKKNHKFSRIHIEQNAEYRIHAHVCASAMYTHTGAQTQHTCIWCMYHVPCMQNHGLSQPLLVSTYSLVHIYVLNSVVYVFRNVVSIGSHIRAYTRMWAAAARLLPLYLLPSLQHLAMYMCCLA